MNGDYLIPANTKKGQLILGLFYPIDLILFGTGIIVTLFLVAILPMDNTLVAVLAISPALITGILVLPVAYYHNVRQLLVEMYKYFTSRNRYVWKGWCFLDESDDEPKQMDRRLD